MNQTPIPKEIPSRISNGYSVLARSRPKSRSGCLTCKVRRKKCDETRPVCKDCQRFHKECVWVDPKSMTVEDVRKLKEKVQARENGSKLRIRGRAMKSRSESTQTSSASSKGGIKTEQTDLAASDFQKGEKLLSFLEEDQPLAKTSTCPPLGNSGIFLSSDQTDDKNSIIDPSSYPIARPSTPSLSYTSMTEVLHNSNLHQGHEEALNDFGSRSNETSLLFLNFLREASQSKSGIDKLTLLDDDEEETGSLTEQCSPNFHLQDSKQKNIFNVYNFLEQVQPLSHEYPTQFLLLASTFNATFTTAPQPALSEMPELDAKGLFLYNYYLETLSKKVSIAPLSQNESNSYQRVFLPLAQKDEGVLYAILAWAGFHLGGKYMREGGKYAEKAVNTLLQNVDFTQNVHIEDRQTIVFKLATILILCGAEICRGDVKIWSVYLDWGWRLLRDNGGILNFDTNKEEHWLISNFAYHDLLAMSERPSYFAHDAYDQIFSDPNGNSKGNLNPLLGVSKALYKVIGTINQFAYESRRPMKSYYGRGSSATVNPVFVSPTDTTSSGGSEQSSTSSRAATLACLHVSLDKAQELDQYIENCRPEMSDLVNLSDRDLELQLTTFEAFQVSCKLHLRQCILKLNPSALECQILVHHLTKCVDILIGTPMQATLVFPIFVAGLYMVTSDDKEAMRRRFDLMMKLYGPWNVVRAKYVVEKVWELNPDGDKWIDWCVIISDLGWELNFA